MCLESEVINNAIRRHRIRENVVAQVKENEPETKIFKEVKTVCAPFNQMF
jgi:hypothetical protein